jgi:hypothetical protein
MKKLILALLFMVACANPAPPPVSVLGGNWNFGYSQITFVGETNGYFTYQKCFNNPGYPFLCPSSPNNGCAQTGTWTDWDAGSLYGQVQFVIQFDTCNGRPEGTTIVEDYSVINNTLTLGLPL